MQRLTHHAVYKKWLEKHRPHVSENKLFIELSRVLRNEQGTLFQVRIQKYFERGFLGEYLARRCASIIFMERILRRNVLKAKIRNKLTIVPTGDVFMKSN